eukprot:CAMPEP_0116863956 /NCGR_PEP_ID=MMETSP0418-20121206/24540_1 /TAXON_ID=1158023 /ORGANISM="Astrosyne radiata, Strain 13vi08-1A" /LENGTH=871 /DNA_ID=CAMNT_0004499095 /DNA_START=467 /DNA_END=3080 /DNA_ORIENTATION=+
MTDHSAPSLFSKDDYLDPILNEVMADPVNCVDGYTYERSVIERCFADRIEAERARQKEKVRGQRVNDDSTCCGGPRRRIELISPISGQVLESDLLIPNRTLEKQIVRLVELGALDMTEQEVEEWKKRHSEKQKKERERFQERRRKEQREEEMHKNERKEEMRKNREEAERRRAAEENAPGATSNGATTPRPTPLSTNRRQRVPACRLVRLDRNTRSGSEKLCKEDTGLSVALCDEADRIDVCYLTADGGSPRCMAACCAEKISSELSWCARCGRLVCPECLKNVVTDISSTSTTKHNICTDCVSQALEHFEPADTSMQQAKAILQRVTVERRIMVLANHTAEIRDKVVRQETMTEYKPRMEELGKEIENLKQKRSQLLIDIDKAKDAVEEARREEIAACISEESTANVTPKPQGDRVQTLEELCARLHTELATLRDIGPPEGNDSQVEEYFTKLSTLGEQLEETELILAIESAANEQKMSPSPELGPASTSGTTTVTIASLQSHCSNLETKRKILLVQHDGDENNPEIAMLDSELEEAQYQLVSALTLDNENDNEAAQSGEPLYSGATDRSIRDDTPHESILHESIVQEYMRLQAVDISFLSTDEQIQHVMLLSELEEKLKQAEKASLSESQAHATDDVAECREYLAAIGAQIEWPLPLGLEYPTSKMRQHLEVLQSKLALRLVTSQRAWEEDYRKRQEDLIRERNVLEEEVGRAETTLEETLTVADAEQKERQAHRRAREEELRRHREEQRRKEEAARQERERQRQEHERQARQEAEELKRRHSQEEEATREAFARVRGDQNNGAEAFGGIGDWRMCKMCKAGPVENVACDDLDMHNNADTNFYGVRVVSRDKPNNCPNCGWFDPDWNQW